MSVSRGQIEWMNGVVHVWSDKWHWILIPGVRRTIGNVKNCVHVLARGAAIIKLQLNVAKWELDPILPEFWIFPKNLGIYIFVKYRIIQFLNFGNAFISWANLDWAKLNTSTGQIQPAGHRFAISGSEDFFTVTFQPFTFLSDLRLFVCLFVCYNSAGITQSF